MTVAAYAAYAVCLWGMLIAAAKLAAPEAVGQFALGLAIATPIVMFCNLQLRAAQVTDASRRFADGEYLALRLISTATALCAICVVAVAIAGFSATSAVIVATGSGKCFEALGDNFQGLFQRSERMGTFSCSLLLKSVLPLLGFAFALAAGGRMAMACLAYALIIAAITVTYDVPQIRRVMGGVVRPSWNILRLRVLAYSLLPLGVAALLSAGVSQIPKYAVTFYFGTRAFAIFAAVTCIVSGAQILASAMGQAALPRLSLYWLQGNFAGFRAVVLCMLGMVVATGLVGAALTLAAGREMLSLFFRPEYAVHTALLLMVVAGSTALSCSWVLTNALQAARLFRGQMLVFGAGSIGTLAAAAAWVPTHGLSGAAVAMLIGSMVQAAGSALLLWFRACHPPTILAPHRSV
jgi:O-antigen/teichoic acid export membrane protein